MSTEPPMSNSELTSEEDPDTSNQTPHKLFLLGYIPSAVHNSTLKTITNDLLSHYYVSLNASKWIDSNGEPSRSRSLMANADVLVFFINEQTLRDSNCLLTLQYAWNLTLPIIMLRPPLTKLVISNRDNLRDREKVMHIGDGAIVKTGEPWQLMNNTNLDKIDFNLLQDVLYEGYRLSTLYDPSTHSKSMNRIRRKLSSIFTQANFLTPMSKGGSSSSSQPHFYLSPSNSSLCDSRKLSKPPISTSALGRRRGENMTLSMSTGNLNRHVRTPHPARHKQRFEFVSDDDDESDEENDEEDLRSIKTRSGRRRHNMKSPPPPERIPSSVGASENEIGEVDERSDIPTLPVLPALPVNIANNFQNQIIKTPTLDLPVETDSEIDADVFPLPPPTPITPGGGLFNNLPSSRATSTSRSRGARQRTFGSVTSRTSSLDRRMSMSCLEDMSNYQKTQYLVFPLRDSSKKPYLIRFPEDMAEEEEKHGGSVWGSDTSLEEEIKLAGKINAGIVVDYMDDSPIGSPAPYLGDLH